MQQRLAQVQSDIELSRQGKYDTSLGYRLAVWDVGLHGIAEKPLFGHGTGIPESYFEKTVKTYKDGCTRICRSTWKPPITITTGLRWGCISARSASSLSLFSFGAGFRRSRLIGLPAWGRPDVFHFHFGFDGYFRPLYKNYHFPSHRYRCCHSLAKEEYGNMRY